MTRAEEIAYARTIDTEVARLYNLYHDVADKIIPLRRAIKELAHYTRMSDVERASRKAKYEARIATLRDEAAPLRHRAAVYDHDHYKGWSRFYLVQHIHNSQWCSSFRPTTRIGWLPDVSGLTAEEAVAAHGETLCTKCFPDAPVALTTKPADPTICTGTRDREAPSRTGYYSGNWATCTCGERVTLTKTGALRKHKTKGA